MKNLQEWAAVQELYKRKVPIKRIAEQLGMSRNTVKKLIKCTEQPKYHREHYKSKLDPYMEQILEWRCEPYEFNGTRIYRELKKKGYQGTKGPIYRVLRKMDEDIGLISSKATVRIETPVGDQAQFDWSDYQISVGGQICTVYCFALILAASRKKAVCFSLKSDADAIYEAIQELFNDLGGVTLELLIDNPKALVLENNPRSQEEIRYNPHALLLAKHLGTELNACPCYWPRKKGKIERPFNYIEEQFVKGNNFATMEELNQRGKAFIWEWNKEVHSTTKRIPDEFYETEEKAALLPLPSKRYFHNALKSRIVSPDSMVSINSNKYSIPVKYVQKTVLFRIVYGFRIEIYDKKETLITTVEASRKKNEVIRDKNHYAAIAPSTSTSIPQIRRDFTKTFQHGALYLDHAGRTFQQPTHHARRILELLELYDVDVLDRFLEYAIQNDQMDIKSFKRLLKERYLEILEASKNTVQVESNEIGLTRDCSYYENLEKGESNGCSN